VPFRNRENEHPILENDSVCKSFGNPETCSSHETPSGELSARAKTNSHLSDRGSAYRRTQRTALGHLTTKNYVTGRKVTDEQMRQTQPQKHAVLPKWNYTLHHGIMGISFCTGASSPDGVSWRNTFRGLPKDLQTLSFSKIGCSFSAIRRALLSEQEVRPRFKRWAFGQA